MNQLYGHSHTFRRQPTSTESTTPGTTQQAFFFLILFHAAEKEGNLVNNNNTILRFSKQATTPLAHFFNFSQLSLTGFV